MKYTVLQEIYPNESATKLKRRNKICIKIIKTFDCSSLADINYLKIAKEINAERRTLYNYFENREEFLICIALCILEDIFRVTDERIKELKSKEFANSKQYLFTLLHSSSQAISLYKTDSILFFKKFDSLFYDLKVDSTAHKNYTIGNQYILNTYNVLDQELYKLVENGDIICPVELPTADVIFLIRESVFCIQKRLLYLQHMPKDSSTDLLKSYIEIIVSTFTA